MLLFVERVRFKRFVQGGLPSQGRVFGIPESCQFAWITGTLYSSGDLRRCMQETAFFHWYGHLRRRSS